LSAISLKNGSIWIIILLVGFTGGFFARGSTETTLSRQSSDKLEPTVKTTTISTPSFTLPKKVINLPGSIMAYVVPTEDVKQFEDVKVTSSTGQQVTLDATQKPMFVMAYWSPDSVESLIVLRTSKAALPTIVSTGFQGNKPDLNTAITDTHKVLKSVDIQKVTPYFALTPTQPISAFPLLVFEYQGQLIEVLGKLPSTTEWARILSNGDG